MTHFKDASTGAYTYTSSADSSRSRPILEHTRRRRSTARPTRRREGGACATSLLSHDSSQRTTASSPRIRAREGSITPSRARALLSHDSSYKDSTSITPLQSMHVTFLSVHGQKRDSYTSVCPFVRSSTVEARTPRMGSRRDARRRGRDRQISSRSSSSSTNARRRYDDTNGRVRES